MSSIAAMISTLKNNKRTRVSTFKKMKDFKEGKNIQVSFKNNATPHQLKNIRKKLQTENRKQRNKYILLFVIGMSIIIYCVGFIKL